MSSEGQNGNGGQAPLRFIELLQAVAAALLGVQSERARKRDFSRGKPMHFIIIGVLATIVFVLTITGIVQLVLHLATGS
ncbi:DUF2970 domain-containing protein [Algiphilus sp.]|uniref:DUF2970 domain-containing protein n=1 Tax=Algiphilus sp. TaxID=1872431 RepID=UPI0025BC8C85|nr:DUF2970 domain-containing protein [Algiphilus sp.]MCK5770087.1 DUF2970 domain-containing protein [Algiphilus sp.]